MSSEMTKMRKIFRNKLEILCSVALIAVVVKKGHTFRTFEGLPPTIYRIILAKFSWWPFD